MEAVEIDSAAKPRNTNSKPNERGLSWRGAVLNSSKESERSPTKWVREEEEAQRSERTFAEGGSERYEACADEVGADCGEGPPVPIPNTAVKLTCAENTRLVTDW